MQDKADPVELDEASWLKAGFLQQTIVGSFLLSLLTMVGGHQKNNLVKMRNLIWDKTWFHLPIKCYNAYIHLATKTTDTVLKGDIWTRGVNTSAAAAASYSN